MARMGWCPSGRLFDAIACGAPVVTDSWAGLEAFFTAGGLHTFANFEREEDFRKYAVGDGFEHSVNLVFIRLMRDVVPGDG